MVRGFRQVSVAIRSSTVGEYMIRFVRTECRRGDNFVLGPLDYELVEGKVTVFLGASGSGKTTTLRLINGMAMPDAGSVMVNGRATTEWDPVELRRGMGYVIQSIGLLPHMDVERNVGIVPRLLNWDRSRTAARVRRVLQLVGLDPGEYCGRYPTQLSGGQAQRVGVARALAADPPILLLDEPFGAVDPMTRKSLQTEFKQLTATMNKTVAFVTHDVNEATAIADRIVVLAAGKIVFSGTADEFESTTNEAVRNLRNP